MRDISRFRRFLVRSELREVNELGGDWENDTPLAHALLVFDLADEVYEDAEEFENRLFGKEVLTEAEVDAYTTGKAKDFIDGGSSILGLKATMQHVLDLYGAGPVLHVLLGLARERKLKNPPITQIAYWSDDADSPEDDQSTSSAS